MPYNCINMQYISPWRSSAVGRGGAGDASRPRYNGGIV